MRMCVSTVRGLRNSYWALTNQGRELRTKQRRVKVEATVRVFDGSGASVAYVRRVTLGRLRAGVRP